MGSPRLYLCLFKRISTHKAILGLVFYAPMIARHVISQPATFILFLSPFELINKNIVPTMMMTSSKPYIFRRPRMSAAKPKPIWPTIVPASVAHIMAVLTDEGTEGTILGFVCGQYTYPNIGVTTLSANNPKASVMKPIPATTTTQTWNGAWSIVCRVHLRRFASCCRCYSKD
jgi:hypothetical protein